MDEAEEAAVWDEYEEVVLGDEGDGEEGEEKDGKDGAGGGIGAEDRRLIKEVRRRRIGMICGHGARRIGMICGHGARRISMICGHGARRIGMICGMEMHHVHTPHWSIYVCVLLVCGGIPI